MISIKCITTVDENHKAVVQLPPDISPGEHQIIVVMDVDEKNKIKKQEKCNGFPTLRVGNWPEDLSLRRDDIYDENGR